LKDLQDLGLRPSGGILEEWMAHYVAEAIARLESGDADAVLAEQCAATIAKLWELREVESQRKLTSGVNSFLRRGTNLSKGAAQELQRAIEFTAKESEDSPLFDGESGVTLLQLGKLEEHALSVLWAATSHAQRSSRPTGEEPGKEQARETDVFSAMEKPIFRSAQSELQKVFPDFKDMSLEDYQKVSSRIQEVLRALDHVRHQILDAEIAAEPSQVPELPEITAEESLLDDLDVFDDDEQPEPSTDDA
jgi:hypothetical protein